MRGRGASSAGSALASALAGAAAGGASCWPTSRSSIVDRSSKKESSSESVPPAAGATFESWWDGCGQVELAQQTARLAGALAERHALRALDAIHLASALALQSEREERVLFVSADLKLNVAAATEGLRLL